MCFGTRLMLQRLGFALRGPAGLDSLSKSDYRGVMSDIKFSCPTCGQHLSGDLRYAGTQIKCPGCQNPFIVPAAPAAAPGAVGAPPGGAPSGGMVDRPPAMPPPPPRPPQPITPPTRTCGLAVASLVCSIGSFLIIPLGFIPGIICGHMAKKRMARDPALGGAGLAKAGLIVGYVALGIQGLVLLAVLGFLVLFGAKVAQQASTPLGMTPPTVRAQRPGQTAEARRRATPAAENAPLDTTPDAAGWTLQLSGVSIPTAPVAGRIKGRSFDSEKASLENGWLKFRQGADFIADLELDVVLFVSDSAALSGKTFTVPKQEFGGNPHIWMKWKPAGRDMPEQASWMKDYAMQLEFGPIADGKLPGKIYLCLPDAEKSFIRGTFAVSVKREAGAPAFTPNRRNNPQPKRN